VTIVQTLAKKYRKSEEIKNRKGEIALHLAGYGGNFDVIKYLVQRWDFSVHQATYSGEYPLHFALQGDLPLEAIVFLGQLYSAAIRIRTVNGRLPLQYAVSREAVPDPNVVEYLVRMCVDSVKQKDNTGNLPLHLLVAHKYLGVEEVQVLVDAWKDSVLEPGPSGMCPVHIAAAHDAPLSVVYYLALQCPGAMVQWRIDGPRRDEYERTCRPRKVPRRA
jgi:hypothetical protein